MATSTAINVLNDESLLLRITKAAHGFVAGDVLTFSAGNYTKAQANSPTNSIIVGIVEEVITVDVFVLLVSGYHANMSGLTANTLYYLSPTTAGLLTATRPTAYNQTITPVFYATSATTGYMLKGNQEMMGYPIQVVTSQLNTSATSSSIIPFDNTAPQISEGTQYISLAITPTRTTNKIFIEFNVSHVSGNGTQFPVMAIFRNDQTNALCAYGGCVNTAGTGFYCAANLQVETVAGTTSALTISLRFGPDSAGTVYMNADDAGNQYLGGTWIATLKATEIAG